MYYELGVFARRVLFQKSIWKDGELWTAIAGGVGSYLWCYQDPQVIDRVRHHFGDLLSAVSIVFGFALAALMFYVQSAAAWTKDDRAARVADKVVDWHVWTIVCFLFLIGYMLSLWSFGGYLDSGSAFAWGAYSVLTVQVLYCGLQILNNTLTVWWVFRTRDRLNNPPA